MVMMNETNSIWPAYNTSYVKRPPEEPGWRIVTLEIAPLAERMQIPCGPFWEKERMVAATSFKE